LAIKLVRSLISQNKALASSRFLTAPRATTLVIDLITNFLRTHFHSLRERDVFHLHEEGEHISTFAGGETVVVTTVGAHMERWCFFIFKGRKPLERISTCRFQLHIITHDLLDRGA